MARGITSLEMAQRIAADRVQRLSLPWHIVSLRLARQGALDNTTTVEEVNAVIPAHAML